MGNQTEEKVENGEAERKNRSTAKATVRRDQEAGDGRTESQVAGSGTEADERKRKGSGKARKREQKGSTCGTAVGAKQGRAKRNKQKAEYRNREG